MVRRRSLPAPGRDTQLPTAYTQAAYLLLSYGSRVRIVEPAGLKEQMMEMTSDLLEYYRSENKH